MVECVPVVTHHTLRGYQIMAEESSTNYTENVKVRLTPEQRQGIERSAERLGLSLSTYLRALAASYELRCERTERDMSQ